MNWDLYVDTVCVGAGVAGLATAISVVDRGGSVFVAAPPEPNPSFDDPTGDRLHRWLGTRILDAETNRYLAALASDLGPFRRVLREHGMPVSVPVTIVRAAPTAPARAVTPFVGARLRAWAARCLASPSGFVRTQVTDRRWAELHTVDGELIEVIDVGSMTPTSEDAAGSLFDWLVATALDRGIRVWPDFGLQRIVFEAGQAVGAVFATPRGPVTVRAERGVTLSSGGPSGRIPVRQPAWAVDEPTRVCLVSRRASRFGRVELLASGCGLPTTAPACRADIRRVHAKLHESPSRLAVYRCGASGSDRITDQ